ncbi:MAG: YrzQ family protein [Bacillota bacterium]|nr:YrzQ family protein [Bacillota bacterium]MDP4155793.1 YrzQ family protein [Bacillota bacterium]
MGRMFTTALAFGAGVAAYNIVQRSNMMSSRQMRQMQKKVKRIFT